MIAQGKKEKRTGTRARASKRYRKDILLILTHVVVTMT